MTRIIVYHDTQQAASRARKPAPGETMGYASIDDFDPVYNATFDEVVNLSTKPLPKSKASNVKGEGHGV